MAGIARTKTLFREFLQALSESPGNRSGGEAGQKTLVETSLFYSKGGKVGPLVAKFANQRQKGPEFKPKTGL